MSKNLFWAMTHPCFDINKGFGYSCCDRHFNKKKDLNRHIFKVHNKEEAIKLMSANDFDKFYKTAHKE